MKVSALEIKENSTQGKSLATILGKKNDTVNGMERFNEGSKPRTYQPPSREQKEVKNLKEQKETKNPRLALNSRSFVNLDYSKKSDINITLPEAHSPQQKETPIQKEILSPQQKEDNITTVARSMNERKWSRPLQSVIVPRYDKNSMAYVVYHIRKEIYDRATSRENLQNLHPIDLNAIKKFQEKFSKISQDWIGLMDFMLKKFLEVDDQHSNNDYYGFKNILTNHILNISLSFIIIGGDTNHGDGIDNLFANQIILPSENKPDKPTIRQKIKKFFSFLPKTMDKISVEYREILKLDRQHSEYLENEEYAISLIQTLNTNIRQQKKDINETTDKTKKKELQEILSEDQKSLQQALVDKEVFEKKIQETIDKKNFKTASIKTIFNDLTRCLDFNYFMHDIWCPTLDYEIMPVLGAKSG
jgi:hypothetical protein